MQPWLNDIDSKCHSALALSLYSGADLFAEDCDSFTPVLAAAVHGNTAAFHCLMESVDMSDSRQNPVFKAIEISCSWEAILNVSFVFEYRSLPLARTAILSAGAEI